ncbi:MAG: DUF1993 family protein [Bdellovibrionales bacterium]
MIYSIVPNFTKGLRNLTAIVGKAETFAESKKVDMNVLMQSRLAPDMFPLAKQIQIVCDTAKLATARLTGKEAPTHDDNLVTWPELKSRIEEVISFLNSFSASDFSGCESKKITTPRWEGKWLTGEEFVHHHALPNFYFHLSMAYAILRHNGVDIGKKDYLGEMPFKK